MVIIYYKSLFKQQTESEGKTNHQGSQMVHREAGGTNGHYLRDYLLPVGTIDDLCWAPVKKETFNTLIHSIHNDDSPYLLLIPCQWW